MKNKAFLYIILAGIFWGTSGIFNYVLKPMGITAPQITAIRGIVSSICMAVYVFFYDKNLFRATLKELLLYICGGVAVFATSASYFFSMQLSSVSTAVVLMYTAPIFVMIYSVLFLGEKFTRLKFTSLVLMMLGASLVSGIIGGFKYSTIGIIFGFTAGIMYSTYNILTKIQMRHGCNPISASMYCFFFMALTALIFSKPMGIIEVIAENKISAIYMLLCGVCTCVLPYFLYTLSLKLLPVGTASALSIIEPMSATLFSVALLGESLNVFTLSGIILILSAVFLLSRSKE